MLINEALLSIIETNTSVDYEGKRIYGEEHKIYVTVEAIENMLNDLLYELDNKEEQIQEKEEEIAKIIQQREEEYRPISDYELYGLSQNDF